MTCPAASSRPRRYAVAAIACVLALIAAAPAQAARPGGGGKADRTAPTVAITAPVAGAKVAGQLIVRGTAADNVALARVEVSVDGAPPVAATGTSSWTSTIDTTKLANGSHAVTGRAIDTAGLAATASVTFEVANAPASTDTSAPTVAIASPQAGATVARQIGVSGTAEDNAGLAKVEVKLDGGSFQPASGTGAWSATIDAAAATDGQHVVTARATDNAGNTASTSVAVLISDQAVQAPAMAAGTLGGFVFQESDRDGIFETGEQPLAGIYVYAVDSAGVYLGNAQTDASGWYAFSDRPDGAYGLEIAAISWNGLKADWVPDTTGSIRPTMAVQLSGHARADFGLRPIVRSTDPAAPISTHVGANGLTVKSFNDVVTAREVFDRLMLGTLVGGEARYVTIRLDITPGGYTYSMATKRNGVYTEYRATSDVSWLGWLRGDAELFHEYGHAWAEYYANLVQQDPSLAAYLDARGLAGDPRIDSVYSWTPGEMIAEDYRQLFGTTSAQAATQANRDIPLANDIAGLREFLSSTFMQTPMG